MSEGRQPHAEALPPIGGCIYLEVVFVSVGQNIAGCLKLYPVFSVLVPKPLQMPKTIGKLSFPMTRKHRGRAIPRFVNIVLIDVSAGPGPVHLVALPSSACCCWSSLASVGSQEGFTSAVDFLSPHWSGLWQWDRTWSSMPGFTYQASLSRLGWN